MGTPELTSTSANTTSCHQATFYQLVWIMTHDLTVFARTWFTLVSIHYQVSRSTTQNHNINASIIYHSK